MDVPMLEVNYFMPLIQYKTEGARIHKLHVQCL